MRFREDDGRQRKAEVDEEILYVEGRPVGTTVVVTYGKQPVKLGQCEAEGCDAPATIETLLGEQLCNKHFGEYFFG
jgi:hypothetical protein